MGADLSLHVSRLTLAAARRPLFLRRDEPFRPGAQALDVSDVLRHVAHARRSVRGPLCLELAGPGDPLASAEDVLRALALIHEHHPDLLTGLTVDGPLVDEYAEELEDFGLAFLRVRLDTLRPRVARRLVSGALFRGQSLGRAEAAQLLVEAPLRALHVARRLRLGTIAQVTLYPTLNAVELETLLRRAVEAGAERLEVRAPPRIEGAPLARIPRPTPAELAEARNLALRLQEEAAPAGPGESAAPRPSALSWLRPERMREVSVDALEAADLRALLPDPEEVEEQGRLLPPRRSQLVAVATEDGTLVDLPLTHASTLRVYAITSRALHALGTRVLPADPRRRLDGVGHARDFLRAVVGCRAVVATRIPARAATLLQAVGISPVVASGGLGEVLDRVARGTLSRLSAP